MRRTLIATALLAANTVMAADPPGVDLADQLTACKKLAADKKLKLTLRGEVGAPEIVAALAPLSCRPIVVSPAAQHAGKVSLEAPDLLTPAEATRLLVSALDTLGLSLEASGAGYRVVDSSHGREIATYRGDGSDAFVLRLVRLSDASADEVAATVGKLKSKDGEVAALPQGRALLLIDRAAQVDRMEALARALDRPSPSARMFVLPTHRQRPSDLVDALEKIALGGVPHGDKPDAARPVLLPVDAARVILFSGSRMLYERMAALLARIDPPLLPGEERSGRIAVIYLRHVDAEDLATTVKDVLGQAHASSTSTSTSTSSASRPSASSASSSNSGALEGDVKITADKVSNSLVVSGSAADLESVRELVMRLDVPRRQVYVEAVVLDLTADLTRTLGLSVHQLGGNQSVQGFAASASSTVNSLTLSPTTVASSFSGAGGLLAGILGPSFNIAGQSVPSFGVVLQALEHSENVNVLSRPHLLTLDHAKASLSVGQKVPFPTGQLSAATTAATPGLALMTNYSREDVALTLELTPHLADDDEVRLEIDGEISDVVADSAGPGGPTTNQRKIKTEVVVRDGETVVLGGLQKESLTDEVDKIPGLGDIPILGRLFQTKHKERIKQDLLIILTLYVIRDATDLRRIYERRDAERRELLERASLFSDPGMYEEHVDYRRKRGFLEELNVCARDAEEEAELLGRARAHLGVHAIAGGEVSAEPSRVEDPTPIGALEP